MRRGNKVTIIEVAERAGVSTATAGRVLGGYGYASEALRKRVHAAAAALDYRANHLAKGLITGRTQTIGVVTGDIESPFYASAVRGIGDVARSRGFGVVVTNSDENGQLERDSVQLLLEKQVDGLIVSPSDLEGSVHLHNAVAGGCPVVQIDRVARGLAADSVTVDNLGAARRCIERLLASGHTRIGMVAELESSSLGDIDMFIRGAAVSAIEPTTLYPSWQRLLGYLEAHRNAGLPVDIGLVRRVGAYSAAAAAAETMSLLSGARAPSALFTADGVMSAGAMAAIAGLGIDIPGRLSLTCFDDLDWMQFMRPGITAVAQPAQEMGRAAAELVLARIDGDVTPFRQVVLPAMLTERGSIGPPAAA